MCKDDSDWIDPESNKFYTGFNKSDKNMITNNNMHKFQNCVIVLDDMGDRLNKDIAYYFTEGGHYSFQMIVMCHKPAQIINTARMSCDTIYLTIYNGPDLFKNFNEIYKCEHDFSNIISGFNSNRYNRTEGMSDEIRYGTIKYNKKENTFIIINSNRTMIYDSRVGFLDLKILSLKDELEIEDVNKLIAYMKLLMINATDRNVINHDDYIFYLNKLLKLNNIIIQNDVLTKEMIMGKGIKILSTIGGIISSGLIIFGYINPDIISRNAGSVAMGASKMLSRVNTLVNVGCGEELDNDLRNCKTTSLSSFADSETWAKPNLRNAIQKEYINIEDGTSNRKGGTFLTGLYGNNEAFREKMINFLRDRP